MNPESATRILAGCVVLLSVALAHWVSQWWLLLTCFAGLNLIQSAFTGFCPPIMLFQKLGWVKSSCKCCASESATAHSAQR